MLEIRKAGTGYFFYDTERASYVKRDRYGIDDLRTDTMDNASKILDKLIHQQEANLYMYTEFRTAQLGVEEAIKALDKVEYYIESTLSRADNQTYRRLYADRVKRLSSSLKRHDYTLQAHISNVQNDIV
jgi:hypothetical protein